MIPQIIVWPNRQHGAVVNGTVANWEPVEALVTVARSALLPVEALGTIVRPGQLPVEALGSLVRDYLLPAEFSEVTLTVVERTALLPVDFVVAPQLFFNWIAAGGGAPVWWREYPTPSYPNKMPRTPAEHLRPKRRGRRRKAPATIQEVRAEAMTFATALIRLHRRRLTVEARMPKPSLVQATIRLVESDEEFLILTGRL